MLRHSIGSHPTQEHQEGSQRPRLDLHAHIEKRKHHRHDEAIVQHHVLRKRQSSRPLIMMQLQQGLRVRQQHQKREEDRPHEADVDGNVDRVVMKRPVKRKLLLQVEYSIVSHNLHKIVENIVQSGTSQPTFSYTTHSIIKEGVKTKYDC